MRHATYMYCTHTVHLLLLVEGNYYIIIRVFTIFSDRVHVQFNSADNYLI